MLSHTKHYGTGEQGFIQSDNVLKALENIWLSTGGRLPTIIVATLATAVIVCFIRRSNGAFVQRNAPFLCAVGVGIAINITGLLKHYAPHYALVLCASLSCVLLILLNEKLPRALIGLSSILVLGALVLNAQQYARSYASYMRRADATQRDLKIIEALPISPGQKRVWGYFSPVKAGVVPMIVGYAGSPFVAKTINGDGIPIDVVPTTDRSAKDWKYVFFPKNYFPTRESVALQYPKQFDFATTDFQLEPTDRLDELETWIMLTRESAAADAPD